MVSLEISVDTAALAASHTAAVPTAPQTRVGVVPQPHKKTYFAPDSHCGVFGGPNPVPPLWVEEQMRGRNDPPTLPQARMWDFSPALRTTWLALTLVLVFLLLISMVVNVSLLLGSRAERSRLLGGSYVYYPLQEMNGELSAAEKDQMGDACISFKD